MRAANSGKHALARLVNSGNSRDETRIAVFDDALPAAALKLGPRALAPGFVLLQVVEPAVRPCLEHALAHLTIRARFQRREHHLDEGDAFLRIPAA
jgi:hypothetical protein